MTVRIDVLLGIQLLKQIPAICTGWIQCLAVAFSIFIQLTMGCIWNIFLLLCIVNGLLGPPTGEKLSTLRSHISCPLAIIPLCPSVSSLMVSQQEAYGSKIKGIIVLVESTGLSEIESA